LILKKSATSPVVEPVVLPAASPDDSPLPHLPPQEYQEHPAHRPAPVSLLQAHG
jgi:hypothetical protein